MRLKILGLALVLLALGASGTQATVMQRPHLTADSTIQRWESRAFGGTVYVHIFVNGEEIEQASAGKCHARYEGAGLYVWARALSCGNPSGAFLLRYVSAGGPKHFTIRLTRNG